MIDLKIIEDSLEEAKRCIRLNTNMNADCGVTIKNLTNSLDLVRNIDSKLLFTPDEIVKIISEQTNLNGENYKVYFNKK